MSAISFEQASQFGFVFPGAREWITPENRARIAQDARLATTPNATVPLELLAYIDPAVVEILTAPRRAREIFGEEKKGSWTTPYAKWRADEITGSTQPYSDYGTGTTSGVNSEWKTRPQYVFQTSITYGDMEVEMSSMARVNLAASKQRSAATVIDIDANRFYLLGVQGKEIYGILNDPDLPPAIAAAPTGTGSSTHWADKGTREIYNDVLDLFAQLVNQSAGLIDQNTSLKLLLSPKMSVRLGAATDFNVSVYDMLMKYFPSLTIVSVPELDSPDAGQTAMLVATEVSGQPTGLLGYGEKLRACRIVPDMSSFRQKFVASTYGGVVLQPFAIAQMTGM